MKNILTPFNLTLLVPGEDDLRMIKPVTVLDTFAANKTDFHEEGLFSTSIFGRIGDELRDYRYSFINIKVPVFHPILYDTLTSLKTLYAGIMAGKDFAIWNPETHDFERSSQLDGRTGFHFFVQHWMDIRFPEKNTEHRQQLIDVIQKYRTQAMTDKVIVMPAGLRDAELEADGRVTKSEVNDFYIKLLAVSNLIDKSTLRNAPELLDNTRQTMQQTLNDLYKYLLSLIDGKKKLAQGKFMSRRLVYGSRNVITAMDTSVIEVGAKGNVTINHTPIALFHVLKGLAPVTKFLIRTRFLDSIFNRSDHIVELVNKKTLKLEEVKLSRQVFDHWSNDEGIEHLIESFRPDYNRHDHIEINDHYLALIYKGPDGTFKVFRGIEELPEEFSKEYVTPLSWVEFFYLSIYKEINKYPVWICRYPVAGMGSNYPSLAYVRTTTRAERRVELDAEWKPVQDDSYAWQFPINGVEFMNATIPHVVKIEGLVADFDGDMVSNNFTMTDESVHEVQEYFKLRRAYVGTDGRLLNSVFSKTVNLVVQNLLRA